MTKVGSEIRHASRRFIDSGNFSVRWWDVVPQGDVSWPDAITYDSLQGFYVGSDTVLGGYKILLCTLLLIFLLLVQSGSTPAQMHLTKANQCHTCMIIMEFLSMSWKLSGHFSLGIELQFNPLGMWILQPFSYITNTILTNYIFMMINNHSQIFRQLLLW